MRRLLAPEVVQTSNMDCGPAALTCLLTGFGIRVSYGRLREACQTDVDGTSIDTLEEVANGLGLEAEQIILPGDHLALPGAQALPAIVIVRQPSGLTHFVVVWRRHGSMLEVMDPAMGRRWIGVERFQNELYRHAQIVPAEGWREFAASDEFETAVRERARAVGCRAAGPAGTATWEELAGRDAALRLVASLVRSGGVARGEAAQRLWERFCCEAALIPARYWTVEKTADSEDGCEQVLVRGAIAVRVKGRRRGAPEGSEAAKLAATVGEQPPHPGRKLLALAGEGGWAAPLLLVGALAVGALAGLLEAWLFRSLLTGGAKRLETIETLLLLGAGLLLVESAVASGALRIGRQMENRLRREFLAKIPKLGDRYFQSRLKSDMAERSHASHRLRRLPDLARQIVRAIFELTATAAALTWLVPGAAALILMAVGAALLIPFLAQPLLGEREARARNHAAGLTRFYLDAMLGLLAIRAHHAERSMRGEQRKLLREWAVSALRFERAAAVTEGLQLTVTFALVIWLLWAHPVTGGALAGASLLAAYWAMNLPVYGGEIGALARQYPYARNLTVRLLEPLGAPEEAAANGRAAPKNPVKPLDEAPRLEFRGVSAMASGHVILFDIDLDIAPGSHVAIVGRSGTGKSSLVGMLLGWIKPSAGQVLVNGESLDVERLRRATAWVDPAVQIWNRTFHANLLYGSGAARRDLREVLEAAELGKVLERLPRGWESALGESGGLVSGGEGQRVRFGRALVGQASRLVILDEPFRGLDRGQRHALLKRARQCWRDATLLCITHDVEETQGFDRVLVMESGSVVEDGTPGELRANIRSRYAQLLAAERQLRSELWESSLWRRVEMERGTVVEANVPASEYA